MRTVVITGSAGFIGFHLSRRLLDSGDRVVGIDGLTEYYDVRLKLARLEILRSYKNYEHHTTLLENAEEVTRIFSEARPSVVFHLAAQAGVRYSIENPSAYISSNITGTFNVLEAVRPLSISHLLFASTSSIYGGNTKLPFAEIDRADSPVSLYAATKKAGEAMIHSYSHLWDIPSTVFRFFTVYGPWGRPDMALFKFVKAIDAGEPIDVYGFGEMSRDFTFVDDLVESIARLSETPPAVGEPASNSDSLSAVAPFRAVNIAGGSPVTLGSFIDAVESATGVAARRNLLPMQPGDVRATSAETSLLRSLIGDAPSTPVEVGVRRFVEWHRSWAGGPE